MIIRRPILTRKQQIERGRRELAKLRRSMPETEPARDLDCKGSDQCRANSETIQPRGKA